MPTRFRCIFTFVLCLQALCLHPATAEGFDPVKAGQIRLAGVVQSLDPKAHTFALSVQGYADEHSTEFLRFDPPRTKTVQAPEAACRFLTAEGADSSFATLQPGLSVTVTARSDNTGVGLPVVAMQVCIYASSEMWTKISDEKSAHSADAQEIKLRWFKPLPNYQVKNIIIEKNRMYYIQNFADAQRRVHAILHILDPATGKSQMRLTAPYQTDYFGPCNAGLIAASVNPYQGFDQWGVQVTTWNVQGVKLDSRHIWCDFFDPQRNQFLDHDLRLWTVDKKTSKLLGPYPHGEYNHQNQYTNDVSWLLHNQYALNNPILDSFNVFPDEEADIPDYTVANSTKTDLDVYKSNKRLFSLDVQDDILPPSPDKLTSTAPPPAKHIIIVNNKSYYATTSEPRIYNPWEHESWGKWSKGLRTYIDGDTLFFWSRISNYRRQLQCWSLATRKLLWKQEVSYPPSPFDHRTYGYNHESCELVVAKYNGKIMILAQEDYEFYFGFVIDAVSHDCVQWQPFERDFHGGEIFFNSNYATARWCLAENRPLEDAVCLRELGFLDERVQQKPNAYSSDDSKNKCCAWQVTQGGYLYIVTTYGLHGTMSDYWLTCIDLKSRMQLWKTKVFRSLAFPSLYITKKNVAYFPTKEGLYCYQIQPAVPPGKGTANN